MLSRWRTMMSRWRAMDYIPFAQAILYISFLVYFILLPATDTCISTGPIVIQQVYYAGQMGYNHSFYGFSCTSTPALFCPECYDNYSCIHTNETLDTHQIFCNGTILLNTTGNPLNNSGHGYFWMNSSPFYDPTVLYPCPLCNGSTWWSVIKFKHTGVFSRIIQGFAYDVIVQYFRIKTDKADVETEVVSTSYQGSSGNQCLASSSLFLGSNQTTIMEKKPDTRTVIYFSILVVIGVLQIIFIVYYNCKNNNNYNPEIAPINVHKEEF